MSWAAFRECYERDAASNMKPSTASKYDTAIAAFERHCRPRHVAALTTIKVAAFARELRQPYTAPLKKGERNRRRSEATIAYYVRHLKAVAR